MEEWENHYHLSVNRCFEMYFSQFNNTIKFRVIGNSSSGERTVINLETNEKFTFVRERLLKREYATLREITCI